MADNIVHEAPFLSNVGFMLTYKCSIACPHCIVKAGPNRTEEMSLESAFDWLDQIRKYRDGFVCGISLTGGEPFYNQEHLLKIAGYADRSGFIVSVVSNAFWAVTKEKALEVLSRFSSIRMVSISTDKMHQLMIPFSHVRNAIWAAKKLGKLYTVAVATENEDSDDYQRIRDEILEITDEEYVNTAIIMPVGRAAKTSDMGSYKLSEEPAVSACSMASFPVIFPNGNVIACIGPPIAMPEFNPLFLGNLNKETIETIFDRAEQNFILHAIRTFGPKTLVKLLKDNGYNALLPKYYIEEVPCDVCFRLFSDKKTCDIIRELIDNDADFRFKTRFGRNYYLNESEMIKEVADKG